MKGVGLLRRLVDGLTTSAQTEAKKHRKRRRVSDPSYSTSRKKSPLQRFASACRLAVRADIEDFRARFFEEGDGAQLCPITGETLTSKKSHVHHEPDERAGPNAFHDLVKDFVRAHNVKLPAVEYLAGRLVDQALRQSFVQHHREAATLRVVSPRANQAVLSQRFPLKK